MPAFLYGLTALIIFAVISTATFAAATFFLNMLLKKELPYNLRRIWNGFVSLVIYTTCFVVTLYAKPEEFKTQHLNSWADYFYCVDRLLKVEFKWFLYVAGFFLAVVGIILISPNHPE